MLYCLFIAVRLFVRLLLLRFDVLVGCLWFACGVSWFTLWCYGFSSVGAFVLVVYSFVLYLILLFLLFCFLICFVYYIKVLVCGCLWLFGFTFLWSSWCLVAGVAALAFVLCFVALLMFGFVMLCLFCVWCGCALLVMLACSCWFVITCCLCVGGVCSCGLLLVVVVISVCLLCCFAVLVCFWLLLCFVCLVDCTLRLVWLLLLDFCSVCRWFVFYACLRCLLCAYCFGLNFLCCWCLFVGLLYGSLFWVLVYVVFAVCFDLDWLVFGGWYGLWLIVCCFCSLVFVICVFIFGVWFL